MTDSRPWAVLEHPGLLPTTGGGSLGSLAQQVEELRTTEVRFAFPTPVESLDHWLDLCS